MSNMLTAVTMETVYYDNQSIFVHFTHNHCLIIKSHFNIYHAIFTKLCMIKARFFGVTKMTSYECVKSFWRLRAYCFVCMR